jgi:hypothetical protein
MGVFKSQFTTALDLRVYSDTVDIPYPNVVLQSYTTGTVSYQLVDTTVDFISAGIQIGDIVWGLTLNASAYVVGIKNSTTLLLSQDILNGGDEYQIYQGKNDGCYIWVTSMTAISEEQILVETINGDIVSFAAAPAGVLPVQVRKVLEGTTAGKLIALW